MYNIYDPFLDEKPLVQHRKFLNYTFCLASSYFARHPITLLLEILEGTDERPTPHLKFLGGNRPPNPPSIRPSTRLEHRATGCRLLNVKSIDGLRLKRHIELQLFLYTPTQLSVQLYVYTHCKKFSIILAIRIIRPARRLPFPFSVEGCKLWTQYCNWFFERIYC